MPDGCLPKSKQSQHVFVRAALLVTETKKSHIIAVIYFYCKISHKIKLKILSNLDLMCLQLFVFHKVFTAMVYKGGQQL